jgi:hypothetical protein
VQVAAFVERDRASRRCDLDEVAGGSDGLTSLSLALPAGSFPESTATEAPGFARAGRSG